VIGLLEQKGALVTYHDPYIPTIRHDGLEMHSVADVMDAAYAADCVVIVTNHSSYDYAALLQAAETGPILVDTRNALGDKGKGHPKVVRL